METNRLRQFCVLYEMQNLRKASECLGMSHGAFFKSLKVLQDDLGQRLYLPEGRGIVITDYGQRFYIKAKELLMLEEKLLLPEKVDRTTHKIGTFEVFSTYLLGSVWKQYFGDDAMELYELLPGHLERGLVDGHIDVGITYEPIPTAGLEFIKMGRVEMGIFAKTNSFSGVPILQVPFVAPASPIKGTPSGIQGLDGWPEDRFPRSILYRVDMMESGLALARTGSAAIFLPRFVARLHNRSTSEDLRLTERRLPDNMKSVSRTIYLIKRKARPESKVDRAIAKILRNECLER